MKTTQSPQDRLHTLERGLRAAGDVQRLRILCVLFGDHRTCVSAIATQLKMSVATASHHLRTLARDDLIEPVRDGKRICYRMKHSAIARDIKRIITKYRS